MMGKVSQWSQNHGKKRGKKHGKKGDMTSSTFWKNKMKDIENSNFKWGSWKKDNNK